MNDERLARRAAAGDKAAFEAIFQRYHQDLYRYCLATVGNPQDAQDAMQNTMVKAMQALPGERREIKLKPWLYRVARNESIETLRKRRDSVELDPEREAASWEIAESTATRERLRQLFADLEELPERQRSALVMRELAGLDFGEIGATFGTSPEVARQTLYEARLSLRQMDEGREMSCETVMRALSDADGRVARRRHLRAHLRGCASCRAFRDGIAERSGEFAAIAPLPVALSAGLLQAFTSGQTGALGATSAAPAAGAAAASNAGGGAAGGGLAGSVGAGVGKTIATVTIAKSAATVAVIAAVGVSAAERGGVVDLPLGGGESKEAKRPAEPQSPAASDATPDPTPASSQVSEGKSANANSQSRVGKASESTAGGNRVSGATGKAKQTGKAAGSSRPSAPPGQSQARPARGGSQGNSAGGKPQATGKPAQTTPPAASRGQEAADTHKVPQADSPPAGGAAAGDEASPPKPSPPPTSEGASAALPSPPAVESETPAAGKGKSGAKGSRADEVEAIEP
jgi:RNA polymerase sigma factor (sigma-70 family)